MRSRPDPGRAVRRAPEALRATAGQSLPRRVARASWPLHSSVPSSARTALCSHLLPPYDSWVPVKRSGEASGVADASDPAFWHRDDAPPVRRGEGRDDIAVVRASPPRGRRWLGLAGPKGRKVRAVDSPPRHQGRVTRSRLPTMHQHPGRQRGLANHRACWIGRLLSTPAVLRVWHLAVRPRNFR